MLKKELVNKLEGYNLKNESDDDTANYSTETTSCIPNLNT